MKTYKYDDSHLSPGEWSLRPSPVFLDSYDIHHEPQDDVPSTIMEAMSEADARAIVPLKLAYQALFYWLHCNLNGGEPTDDVIELCITLDPRLENYKTLQILIDAGVVTESEATYD